MRSDNPTTDVEGPDRGAERSDTFLYPSEFSALVACPAVPLSRCRLYALATFTGLRAGELAALAASDVDLEHRVLSVTKSVDRVTGGMKTTKTGVARLVPIERELLPLVRTLLDGPAREPWIWMPPPEDRASLLRKDLRTAGVTRAALFADSPTQKPLTFHDLRATALTWWAVQGVDPLKIMQRAGHRSFQTTQRYVVLAELLRGAFGTPFPALPLNILESSTESSLELKYDSVSARNSRTYVATPTGIEPVLPA